MFGALKGESYVGAQALEQKGGRGNLLRPVTKKNSELCPAAGAGTWRQNLKQVMTQSQRRKALCGTITTTRCDFPPAWPSGTSCFAAAVEPAFGFRS